MSRQRRVVDVPVLPGQDADAVSAGTGRVCIHLIVRDPAGTITEPHVLHPVLDPATGEPVKQQCEARPTRMRLACDRRRGAAPIMRGGVIRVTPRTDDPRAATCPKCLASVEYAELMKKLED